MYVLYQTQQAPLQTDWCSLGLTQFGRIVNTSPTSGYFQKSLCPYVITPSLALAKTGVYSTPDGLLNIFSVDGNIYSNQLGILTFLFFSTGATIVSSTIAPPYKDISSGPIPAGSKTTYNFTIVDTNTGQGYTVLNYIIW